MTAEHQRYALIFERAVGHPPRAVVDAHRARLDDLEAQGRVVMAGPFEGGGGLVILEVAGGDEAQEIADADPFVIHGTHRYRLLRWLQDLGAGAAPAGEAGNVRPGPPRADRE